MVHFLEVNKVILLLHTTDMRRYEIILPLGVRIGRLLLKMRVHLLELLVLQPREVRPPRANLLLRLETQDLILVLAVAVALDSVIFGKAANVLGVFEGGVWVQSVGVVVCRPRHQVVDVAGIHHGGVDLESVLGC